jgi:hypothetical protein
MAGADEQNSQLPEEMWQRSIAHDSCLMGKEMVP